MVVQAPKRLREVWTRRPSRLCRLCIRALRASKADENELWGSRKQPLDGEKAVVAVHLALKESEKWAAGKDS
jgi:hypothetical protein